MGRISPNLDRLVADVSAAVERYVEACPEADDLVADIGAVMIERMALLLVSHAALGGASPEMFTRGVREIAEVFQVSCLSRAAASHPELLTDPLFGTRPAGRA